MNSPRSQQALPQIETDFNQHLPYQQKLYKLTKMMFVAGLFNILFKCSILNAYKKHYQLNKHE